MPTQLVHRPYFEYQGSGQSGDRPGKGIQTWEWGWPLNWQVKHKSGSFWMSIQHELMLTSGNWDLPPVNLDQQAWCLGWRQHMWWPDSDQTSAHCMPCPSYVSMWLSSMTQVTLLLPRLLDTLVLYVTFIALETMVSYTHTHLFKYIHFKLNCQIVQLSNNCKCYTWETYPAPILEVKWIATFHFSKKLL